MKINKWNLAAIVLVTAASVFITGCGIAIGSGTEQQNARDGIFEAETKLNPGKSLFDMMRELTFDGITFYLPCKVSDLPDGFTLVDESFIKSGDRFELYFNGSLAGFVIVKDKDDPDKATVDILSVDIGSSVGEEPDYCDFEMSGISFKGKSKSDIETLFADYTYSGDKSLLVYSFIDGSAVFNFDENGICNFVVIGGRMA